MRLKPNVYFLAVALLISVSSLVNGQSTDPSNATPITTNELIITGPKKTNQQYYYSVSAGPGEVTMTFNVKAKSYSTFVGIKVYDSEMNTLTYHNMSADTSSPGLAKKTFEIGEKQTLVMSFTSDSSLSVCKITFGGAVDFTGLIPSSGSSGAIVSEMSPQVATDTSTASVLTPSSTSSESVSTGETASAAGKNNTFAMSILDAVGQRFKVPANGKLRIEMKDGSVQEIDLTQVKKILVKK